MSLEFTPRKLGQKSPSYVTELTSFFMQLIIFLFLLIHNILLVRMQGVINTRPSFLVLLIFVFSSAMQRFAWLFIPRPRISLRHLYPVIIRKKRRADGGRYARIPLKNDHRLLKNRLKSSITLLI
jgi:hypothetical protein